MSEVVALFSNESDAERAVSELYSRGYDADTVGYVNRHRNSDGELITEETYVADDMGETEKGVTGGAVGGAAVGAGTSLLASAGMLLIPGIGPFLAAGSLAATLAATAVGAAGGAAIGGSAGAIFGDSTDDDDLARRYRTGVESGNALVTVHFNDGERQFVTDILRNAGAKEVDTYGADGWDTTTH